MTDSQTEKRYQYTAIEYTHPGPQYRATGVVSITTVLRGDDRRVSGNSIEVV